MKLLYDEREAAVYWATNHFLPILYSDSNTQETMKSFYHYRKRILLRCLTVIEALTYFQQVFMPENDIITSKIIKIKTDVTKN